MVNWAIIKSRKGEMGEGIGEVINWMGEIEGKREVGEFGIGGEEGFVTGDKGLGRNGDHFHSFWYSVNNK